MSAALWASLTATWSSQAVLVSLLLGVALLSVRAWLVGSQRVLSRTVELSIDLVIIVLVLLFFFFIVVRFQTLA